MGCSRWGWLVGPTELRRARLTTEAVLHLQGDGPPLLVRIYVPWMGGRSTVGALAQVGQLVESVSLSWDLVLAYPRSGG